MRKEGVCLLRVGIIQSSTSCLLELLAFRICSSCMDQVDRLVEEILDKSLNCPREQDDPGASQLDAFTFRRLALATARNYRVVGYQGVNVRERAYTICPQDSLCFLFDRIVCLLEDRGDTSVARCCDTASGCRPIQDAALF